MTDLEISKFDRYLMIKGAFEKFYRNFIHEDQQHTRARWSVPCNIEEYLQQASSSDVIQLSFLWSETPEGHQYWEKIRDNWMLYKGKKISFSKLTKVI